MLSSKNLNSIAGTNVILSSIFFKSLNVLRVSHFCDSSLLALFFKFFLPTPEPVCVSVLLWELLSHTSRTFDEVLLWPLFSLGTPFHRNLLLTLQILWLSSFSCYLQGKRCVNHRGFFASCPSILFSLSLFFPLALIQLHV